MHVAQALPQTSGADDRCLPLGVFLQRGELPCAVEDDLRSGYAGIVHRCGRHAGRSFKNESKNKSSKLSIAFSLGTQELGKVGSHQDY